MNNRWVRLVGIPLVAGLMWWLHSQLVARDAGRWLVGYLVALSITSVLWEGNLALSNELRRRLPAYAATTRRLLGQAAGCVVYTCAATVALDAGWQLLGVEVYASGTLLKNCLLNLAPTFFVLSIYESAHFLGQWKQHLLQTEALTRAGLLLELEALRSQLDPHFMFNSLNTLAALIEADNEPAHTYLEQLADVYRYVLLSRGRETVPLAEELAFVDAYVYLTKTRFRDDLQVAQRIDPAAYATRVAPLSVQLLVENALKHNEISPERPLHVRIATEDGAAYLRVENNVQPRTTLLPSTRVGLRNLINCYQLLSAAPVQVLREADHFTVRIPLLP